MVENKSLNDLMKATDKVLESERDHKDSSDKLREDALSGGAVTRAEAEKKSEPAKPAAETKPESKPPESKPPESKQEEKPKAEPGSLVSIDGGVGVGKGVVKGVTTLVSDTYNMFFNHDTDAVLDAARRGDRTKLGTGFLTSLTKTGSELTGALGTVITNPGDTFSKLSTQIQGDYTKGSSEKKGEMVGEGIAFALTLGIGTSKLKGLTRWGKMEEAAAGTRLIGEGAALAREGRIIQEAGALGRLGAETRVLKEGGTLAERLAFLNKGTGAERLGAGMKLGETVEGLRTVNLSTDAAKVVRLETTVEGLAKGAGVARELGAAERISGFSRLTQVQEGNLFSRLTKAEQTLAEMEGAHRAIGGQVKLARELTVAREGTAVAKEAQLLAKETKAVEDAMAAVRTAQSDAAGQVAMRELRTSVETFNKAVEGNALTASRAAELKITEAAVVKFETAAGRTSELMASTRVEGTASKLYVADRATVEMETRAQQLTGKIDDVKAASSAVKVERGMALETKAAEVEQSMQKVKAAETAVAREQAITELRTNVQQFNKAVEASPLTASRAAELRITERSVAEFEVAAREANRAKALYTSDLFAANLEGKSQAFAQNLQRGEKAVQGTEAAVQYRAQAQKVEEAVQKVRLAETSVAREQALAEMRSSVQSYNKFVETNAVTSGKAAELRIAQSGVRDFELAVRESNHARTLVSTEAAVTAATVKAESAGQAIVAKLGESTPIVTGAKVTGPMAAEATAIQAQAIRVQESVRTALSARDAFDMHWAADEVRSSIRAYNEVVSRSALTAGRAGDLRISESIVSGFEKAASEANYARRLAEADLLRSGSYMSRLAGQYAFLAPESLLTAGPRALPMNVRADGLVDVAGGGFRSRLRNFEETVGQPWSQLFERGFMIKGLTRERALALASYTYLGSGIYYFGKEGIEQVNRTRSDSPADGGYARQSGAGTTGGGGSEGKQATADSGAGRSADTEAARAADTQAVRAENQTAQTQALRAQEAQELQAARAAEVRELRTAAAADGTQVFARARQEEAALSPYLHALRQPGYQAQATETIYQLAEARREEARKRRLNQWGQDWGGPHVYLKAPEAAVADQTVVAMPIPQVRRFGGSEPDVPRVVAPTFRPQMITATQAELFGSVTGRAGDARPVLAVGGDSSRRGRGGVVQNEEKLVKLYPFLSTSVGETGVASGTRTVFRSGIERKERPNQDRASGGTTAQTGPGAQLGAAQGTVAVAPNPAQNQADPNNQQDED